MTDFNQELSLELKSEILKLIFPESQEENWRKVISSEIKHCAKSPIEFDCREWKLTCQDIKYLDRICRKEMITIKAIRSSNHESIISASSLGIPAFFQLNNNEVRKKPFSREISDSDRESNSTKVFFHKGTLRSGELLEADCDLLVLGDVNPGATVIAGGNIMIWGRLLGIAHAGKEGNDKAKISALQLRPVQLRIASKIARGPEEKPEIGLAEEARIENEIIVIQPAGAK